MGARGNGRPRSYGLCEAVCSALDHHGADRNPTIAELTLLTSTVRWHRSIAKRIAELDFERHLTPDGLADFYDFDA